MVFITVVERAYCAVRTDSLYKADYVSSSSSSSSIFHGVGPLVDPFRSHASRSLFNGLPWFLLPVGEYCFITFGNLLRGILFTCCIQFLLYSCSLSRIGVIFNSFAICLFVLWSVQVYPAVLLTYFAHLYQQRKIYVYLGLHDVCRVFLFDLNQTQNFSTDFNKSKSVRRQQQRCSIRKVENRHDTVRVSLRKCASTTEMC